MSRVHVIGPILWACLFSRAVLAQVPTKVDFRRDVQPIFKAYCIGCHGPTQQMNGFRLDRRVDAMRGGTIAVIGPGNGAGSRLYLKLVGNQYGPQMPPTGALTPEQIDVIKRWIDQGAEWPDDLSGETPMSPPDPKATHIMEALRRGDHQAFKEILRDDPHVANLKGPGGSTPLMYAALYGTFDSVRLLLDSGADPNVRNDAGATALMWAVDDLEKARLLLGHGADANARSDEGRTPLIIAAGRFGSGPLVKLLLDRNADPSVKSSNGQTPLSQAARAGDETVLGMLIERGADLRGAGPGPLAFAIRGNCKACIDRLIEPSDKNALNRASLLVVPPDGDAQRVNVLIDHGADVNAKDPQGRTILMLAASSDALPVETVKSLIERGADVNANSTSGETALVFAKQRGKTPVVDLLVQAGAKNESASTEPVIKSDPANVRTAIERSIPLLQRTDVSFIKRSGCVSCHNNSLTAMTIATARKSGLRVDDQIARLQLKTIGSYIESWRERALQDIGIAGGVDTVSYILLGMAAEKYPPDAATDAMARYLRRQQSSDGRWWIRAHRPPIESSDIQDTATAMRAIQVYSPATQRAEYQKAVLLAADWLRKAQPTTNEDRVFQLLGLGWAGANNENIRKSAHELLAEQRPDGGWAQLPSLASDAYATGQALVALKEVGVLAVNASAYQRGIHFLLNTQLEDGSWYVKSRAIAVQPYFDNGFPHGPDQWISAAATNWATMALASAARR